MNLDDKEFSHVKLRVKYKTRLNLVWGKPLINTKKEALAYPTGFPATFYMTDRRVFVIGTFLEKQGLFRKKTMNTVYFEAGLQYVKKSKLEIYKQVKSGYISFESHGDIKDGVVHFLKLTPDMIRSINKVLENVINLKKTREDTGYVVIGDNPMTILRKRLVK
ncbi:MAG: hypothetical protein EU530_06845 [Promethearchaeota archaeon]|nr:MAG: hypothetical protein EU530_06845 [Candidatus Lokiarchaeota archaeon]